MSGRAVKSLARAKISAQTGAAACGSRRSIICQRGARPRAAEAESSNAAAQLQAAHGESKMPPASADPNPSSLRIKTLRPAAAMDCLPSDVVLLILRKLAVQDPLSLLRATCALAPFHRGAAVDPEVWKRAFYGPEMGQSILSQVQRYFPEEVSKLDAEVNARGGPFRRLLIARLRPKHNGEASKQNQTCSECNVLSGCFQPELFHGGALIVARTCSSVVLWGLLPEETFHCQTSTRDSGYYYVAGNVLRPVSSLTWMGYFTTEDQRRRVSWGSIFKEMSVEVYGSSRASEESKKKWGKEVWYGTFHKLCYLREKTGLLSLGPHGSQARPMLERILSST